MTVFTVRELGSWELVEVKRLRRRTAARGFNEARRGTSRPCKKISKATKLTWGLQCGFVGARCVPQ